MLEGRALHRLRRGVDLQIIPLCTNCRDENEGDEDSRLDLCNLDGSQSRMMSPEVRLEAMKEEPSLGTIVVGKKGVRTCHVADTPAKGLQTLSSLSLVSCILTSMEAGS